MKTKQGEYIELCWDGLDPQHFCVKGHVSEKEAIEAIQKYVESQGVDAEFTVETLEDFESPVHKYARWEQSWYSRSMGYTGVLRLYEDRGSGKFPVTVFHLRT